MDSKYNVYVLCILSSMIELICTIELLIEIDDADTFHLSAVRNGCHVIILSINRHVVRRMM